MKKTFLTLISIALLVCVVFAFAACDVFSGGGNNNGNGGNGGNNNGNNDDNTEDPNAEKQKLLEEYQAIIEELLEAMENADSLEGYVTALAAILKEIPRETVTDGVGMFADEETVAEVDAYYDKAITIATYAQTYAPYIKPALTAANYIASSDALIAVLNSGIQDGIIGAKVRYDKATEMFLLPDQNLKIKINEAQDLFYIEEGENKYEIYFNAENTALCGKTGKIADEGFNTDVETRIIDSILYVQLHDVKNGQLFQAIIDVSTLEATVSIASADGFTYSIIETVPDTFATVGLVLNINEDMVSDLLTLLGK